MLETDMIASSHILGVGLRTLVTFLALFSDWVKGAYIYALYSTYGYHQSQIAVLYVTGFASSALFGTFTGCLADSLGRRNMALVFTLVYALSAICKERNKNTRIDKFLESCSGVCPGQSVSQSVTA